MLIESDKRKAEFLRTIARETGVGFKVVASRIEQTPPANAKIVSARALAPLPTLMSYHHRHARKDGVGLFQKGVNWRKEVEAAQRIWQFEFEAIESRTQDGAAILKIEGVSRA